MPEEWVGWRSIPAMEVLEIRAASLPELEALYKKELSAGYESLVRPYAYATRFGPDFRAYVYWPEGSVRRER